MKWLEWRAYQGIAASIGGGSTEATLHGQCPGELSVELSDAHRQGITSPATVA
ncbi:MAG: hypothetical protein M9900_02900 [Flavobacteriales bacterium]|nr:hypothetical protein [Flavobacteriales bacterium]HRN37067.1 hypothetical protein [Flavobacteriales bacterium]